MKQKQDVSNKPKTIDEELRNLKLAGLNDLRSRTDDVIEQLDLLIHSPYVQLNSVTERNFITAWSACKNARDNISYQIDNI